MCKAVDGWYVFTYEKTCIAESSDAMKTLNNNDSSMILEFHNKLQRTLIS